MTTILDLSSRNPERYLQKMRSYEKITLNVSNKLNDNSRSRDGLLRTLLGIESGLSDIQLGDNSSLHGLSSIPEIKKSKKRAGSRMELDSPSTPSSIMQFYRRIPSVKNTAYGALVFNPCRRQAHIFPRSATLYHTYRQPTDYSDEILSSVGRPPIILDPDPETGGGNESRPNAHGARYQQFQARHAHPRELPAFGISY